jgi:hypothetical protein
LCACRTIVDGRCHFGLDVWIESNLYCDAFGFGTVSNGYCDAILEPTGAGMGCGDFTPYPYGVSGYGGSEGGRGHVTLRVPEATAAVTISINGAGPLWQRPVVGWAFFPSSIHDVATFSVDAYDATGTPIGHWEETT